MEQPTFADLEFENKKRKTRREMFLERMDELIPWQRLEARIRPYYPKAGRGRRPYDLSVVLRAHCVQVFYNLSDPGMEDPRFHGGRLCCMRRSRCGGSWGCGCGREPSWTLRSLRRRRKPRIVRDSGTRRCIR